MMDTPLFASEPEASRPALPVPKLPRWQPLRLGLVELYHYDSEEFWFRDGHLLLRGNNGTGKSKVLSLTLPFLLDAQVKPSRIEPDGDGGKRMSWNLLMGTHPRRMGYAWLEFGRVADDGQAHYLTLGAGLSAAEGKPQVDCWYFVIEAAANAARVNQDLWLTSEQRVVLTKERLREALQGRGQVFETARSYRRAVDERLFHLGQQRYDALMDTLIQLRQPQLSKKPDEGALSDALSEALPPLSPDLVSDVADAMGQLEEDRRQLEEYQALARAVTQFERRYRLYAGTRSRREAGLLRNAQTEHDNASRARNEAQTLLEAAEQAEASARAACEETELALRRAQARLETLRADPTNQDANRLENCERDAQARRRALEEATRAVEKAEQRLRRDAGESRRLAQRIAAIEARLAAARRESAAHADAAGIAAAYSESALAVIGAETLVALPAQRFDQACSGLRALAVERRKDIAMIRGRLAQVASAEGMLVQRREARDEKAAALQEAIARRESADQAVDAEGEALIAAWERHLADLEQLAASAEGRHSAVTALGEWVRTLDGDNPARCLLQTAQQEHNVRSAQRRVVLEGRRRELEGERTALEDERSRLENGVDAGPPAPYTRNPELRTDRVGAPLWQLVDFRSSVSGSERAGIEAALEISGLLDAWLSPDGRLQADADGKPILDVQALARAPSRASPDASLWAWLEAAVPTGCPVPASTVTAVLAGIACAADDPGDCEAWVAPDGRFRLGALAGAWAKPEAAYVGFAARAAARVRRLAAIAERLMQLADELARLKAAEEQLVRDIEQAAEEWRLAPADDALRQAHLAATACVRDFQIAREQLAAADVRFEEAEHALRGARERLVTDAADLNLPTWADALPAVEAALDDYLEAQAHLCHAASDVRQALPELERQRRIEQETRDDLQHSQERSAGALIEAEQADARLAVLRETIGAKVEDLRRQLSEAKADVDRGEAGLKEANTALRECGEARAIAGANARTAAAAFEQRSSERADAVARFHRFAATGLLLAAWPEAPVPDLAATWTIDPALTLARRTEQALSDIRHDDAAWERVQKEVAGDATELQRALNARGQQAHVASSDFGLVVHVLHQGRRERPDRIALYLSEEIAQRNELLTAKEREILEGHLESEIAAEIQRLLQAAEAQRNRINDELHRRPTSTGVRYRLLWPPLGEQEGAPVGLEVARKRLLNASADLWTAEDRRVIGTMLQSRIAAEREAAAADGGPANGPGTGTLADQLARALDYRRWHRFRVERWQDGSWRKLSGPASSGERALGLTVPLFAAVASFYSQGGSKHAPRLMLLDEAFAGIDDAARAHCMGLIRAFDLDFVITSEREWACYAELPGVSICQLQRKEGIDAVYVSRWTWDGLAKTRAPDPDRRFAPQ
jgi:uncharacterized protein (TIGR02680 family)